MKAEGFTIDNSQLTIHNYHADGFIPLCTFTLSLTLPLRGGREF